MRERRTRIPGVPKDAERNLEGLFRELDDRLKALERKSGRAGVVSVSTAARVGEFLNIEAPAAGLSIVLPAPTAARRGDRITLNFRNSNPVKMTAIDGLVNGETQVLSNAPGMTDAVCDGLEGWHLSQSITVDGVVGAPGTPTADTWADVLANGNTSGASNPTVSSAQHLAFAVGGEADGDIRSAGPLVITAADTMHLHTTGDLHVGHSGTTQVVHVEGSQIDLESGSDILAQAATSIDLNAGTSASVIAGAGDATVQASASVRLVTGGVERLEIEPTGAWQLGGLVGTAGQYPRSSGAGDTPLWATIQYSELQTIAGLSVLGRSAATDGVAAAITADTARQVLRYDGTSLAWGFPIRVFAQGGSAGIVDNSHSINFVNGTNTTAAVAGVAPNPTVAISVDDYPLSGLANQDARTVVANATNASAAPTAVQANTARHVWRDNGANTALEWGYPIAISVNSGAQTDAFSIDAINGTHTTAAFTPAAGGASFLSFSVDVASLLAAIDSTTIVVSGTTLVRANLTGAVTALQNSNATLFGVGASGDGLVGGGTSTLAVGPGTFISVSADAVSMDWSGFMNAVESTSVVRSSDQFQRAALTGAVEAALNSNSTVFGASAIGSGLTGSGTATVKYSGTTGEVTIASATGNLGTINIADLECGGSVRVTSASSAFSIEGFTAKTDGFWFYFQAEQGLTNHCTLFQEDLTATAVNRLALPRDLDMLEQGVVRGIFYYRGSRWRWTGANGQVIGLSAAKYIGFSDTSGPAEVVSSSDVNITAGSGSGSVVVAGNELDVNTGDMTLTPVPRSDGDNLGVTSLSAWAPLFYLRKDVTSGTGAAGDTVIFSGDAPFAFRVLASGVDVTTGIAGSTVTLRSATGGGGSAMSSAMSTATSGTVQYSASFTGIATVALNGTLVARWSDRDARGVVWALCART